MDDEDDVERGGGGGGSGGVVDGHSLIAAAAAMVASSSAPTAPASAPLISPTSVVSPSSFDSLLTPAGSPEEDALVEPWIQTV